MRCRELHLLAKFPLSREGHSYHLLKFHWINIFAYLEQSSSDYCREESIGCFVLVQRLVTFPNFHFLLISTSFHVSPIFPYNLGHVL